MSVDAMLEITPADTLEFTLQAGGDATPKVVLSLEHPDGDAEQPIAFKVKTTQPRRYLVRPNQGLIRPGQKEAVTIILVEKDKNQLLTSYASLGAAALEHCKDKFLVQSVAVSAAQADELQEYDQLTALWTGIQSGGGGGGGAPPTANKKLHVKHRVAGGTAAGAGGADAPTPAAAIKNPEKLPKEELVVELTNLRRKYDELVSFSVNLTAERDVLNNALEQTKRDLNREVAAHRSSSSGGAANRGGIPAAHHPPGPGMAIVFIYVVTALLAGAKLQQMGLLHGLPGFANVHSSSSGSPNGYGGGEL